MPGRGAQRVVTRGPAVRLPPAPGGKSAGEASDLDPRIPTTDMTVLCNIENLSRDDY